MKAAILVLAALLVAAPAHAQLGGLINKAQKAKGVKDKVDDFNITEKEERQLGEHVSARVIQRFGVYQDKDVAKYVSLVGGVLAQQSSRPGLDWTFIVLDTDGVNAYAAPGGIIHVTRGLLGLARNEAELAGILGHEITHVTVKHTVRAIQQSKGISIASDQAGSGSLRNTIIARMADKTFTTLFEGEFSRDDENEADKAGVQLASKLGYAPAGIVEVLKKIDARNSGRDDRNGLFASHPATKERIEKIEKQIKDEKLNGTATAQARYAKNITFEAKPVTEIAVEVEGAAGLAGDGKSDKDTKEEAKKDEPKKKGGLLGKVGLTRGSQAQNTQTVASAGARGGLPDRDAKGGTNKNPLGTRVTAAELEAFRKGIAA
jgi:predicted Zn-dependent protease